MSVADRLAGGLVPAVPVPFRGDAIDEAAQRGYARWMAAQPVAGVAVWAHTGRGPHLSADQRREVLDVWREALPDRLVVAGARDVTMAIEARRGRADALLAFPERDDPVGYHRRLSRELPVIAFWLYEAAGGVAYDDATLHAILDLPDVSRHQGGDARLGHDLPAARRRPARASRQAARHRRGPLPRLLDHARRAGGARRNGRRAARPPGRPAARAMPSATGPASTRSPSCCDRLAEVTFIPPMEGYVRRMLWAAAADGALPAEACDDPWGPPLPPEERAAVERVVRDARSARA